MPALPEILTNSKFYVELSLDGSLDTVDAYFAQCNGFQRSLGVVRIAEVTPQKWGAKGQTPGRIIRTKMPGNTSYSNITLMRGLTVSPTLWTWFRAVEEGKWGAQTRNGDITIYDQGAEERVRLRFLGAWPVNYQLSGLDASGASFILETLELSVDEFMRVK